MKYTSLEVCAQLTDERVNVIDLRALRPSIPAVRAPRLRLTRHQATYRNAGSQTRLYRSSKCRCGSSLAHRCSLVWIPSTRSSAVSGVSNDASIFINVLLAFQSQGCELAVPLRHVAGFPSLRLLRELRPDRDRQLAASLPIWRLEYPRQLGNLRSVPTFTTRRSSGAVSSFSPATSLQVRRRLSLQPPRWWALHLRRVAHHFYDARALLTSPYPPGLSWRDR